MKMREATLKTERKRKVAVLLTPLKGIKDCTGANGRVNSDNYKVQDSRPGAKTEIEAKIDVGWGNALYIRGQGGGLTWDKGVPLTCFNGSSWVWFSSVSDKVIFKLLLNDQIW